jgi:hypothetical protein
MKKRFLIAVLLQILTLNFLVHGSVHYLDHDVKVVVGSHMEAGSDDMNENIIPPIEEGDADEPLSESEDEISYTHHAVIVVSIPVFAYHAYVHPDQQALEGSSSCLLKPPTVADIRI